MYFNFLCVEEEHAATCIMPMELRTASYQCGMVLSASTGEALRQCLTCCNIFKIRLASNAIAKQAEAELTS